MDAKLVWKVTLLRRETVNCRLVKKKMNCPYFQLIGGPFVLVTAGKLGVLPGKRYREITLSSPLRTVIL